MRVKKRGAVEGAGAGAGGVAVLGGRGARGAGTPPPPRGVVSWAGPRAVVPALPPPVNRLDT